MSHIPVPANQVLSCPFGGNPKVAAQMGIPSCGIARPGPFFANLNRPQGGGKRRKTRRRRGGNPEAAVEPAVADQSGLQPTPPETEKPVEAPCPAHCVKKESRFQGFRKFFGLGGRRSRRGGRKSRRGGNCASHKKNEYGGRKSRRGGRKSRRGGRKSRI